MALWVCLRRIIGWSRSADSQWTAMPGHPLFFNSLSWPSSFNLLRGKEARAEAPTNATAAS